MASSGSFIGKRWPWLTAAAIVLLVYASTFVSVRIGSVDKRSTGEAEDIERLAERGELNVLFILIDTLRADRLSAYGYERPTSPALDRLAENGVRFAHNLSQSSWTKSSMASLWTGLYPVRTGVTRYDDVVSSEARLPAEVLREHGFRTAGLFRNGWVEGYFGFDQGFDFYSKPSTKPLPGSVLRKNPTIQAIGSDDNVTSAAKEFLRIYGDERWFLYMHLMDLHEYVIDEATARFGTSYSDVYDNAILRVDHILDDFFSYLAIEGHLENTLLIVASDHGEAFGERGFEGHARRLYRESTEVPLIISFPFKLEPGLVVDGQTSNVDIWPTIFDLLKLPPATEDIDGRSRLPEILAAARAEPMPAKRAPQYAHLDQTWGRRGTPSAPTVAVVDGDYRYVVERDARGIRLEQLFDRRVDAAELRDRLADEPEVAEEMRRLAETYLDHQPPWTGGAPTLEIDEIQLNQLRALGYQVP